MAPGANDQHIEAQIDLRITNLTAYYAWDNNGRKWNGLKRFTKDGSGVTSGRYGSGGFGSVNLKGPRSPKQNGWVWRERATYVELLYEFINGRTGASIRLPRTYLTFYDFDVGTARFNDPSNIGSTEAMQMDPSASTAAYLTPMTELHAYDG